MKEKILHKKIEELLRKKQQIPEPTRTFVRGDVVRWGIQTGTIERIIDHDAMVRKFYLVSFSDPSRVEPMPWFSIVSATNTKVTKLSQKFENIRKMSYHDVAILHIIEEHLLSGYATNSFYHRKYEWNVKEQEEFLDSVFAHMPLGHVTVIITPSTPTSAGKELLDGKQRLITLTEFFLGNIRYRGVYYHELSNKDRSRFDNATIRVAEVRPDARMCFNDKEKLRLYIKLNFRFLHSNKNHLEMLRMSFLRDDYLNDD